MSHEITQTAGRAEMAYVGDVPWHGLGQCLSEDASIDVWREQAGMDWTIRRVPLHYFADRQLTDRREVQDEVGLIRSDTGNKLGIVGTDYQVVQPFQVLEFFRDLVADQGFKLHTAGTLFGGRRFWALARISEVMFSGWDKVGGYLLLSTTADGTRATEARETTVRVVCNNTLSMAVAEDAGEHCIRLTHRNVFDADRIKKSLSLSAEHFATWAEATSTLTKMKMSSAAAEEFMMKIMRPGNLDEEARRPRGLDDILALFNGAGLGAMEKGSKGTAWGLVNAVTEYVDHHATAASNDHLIDRALWGTGAAMKSHVFTQLVAEAA